MREVDDEKKLTVWLQRAQRVMTEESRSSLTFELAREVSKLIPELRRRDRLYDGLMRRIERGGGAV